MPYLKIKLFFFQFILLVYHRVAFKKVAVVVVSSNYAAIGEPI